MAPGRGGSRGGPGMDVFSGCSPSSESVSSSESLATAVATLPGLLTLIMDCDASRGGGADGGGGGLFGLGGNVGRAVTNPGRGGKSRKPLADNPGGNCGGGGKPGGGPDTAVLVVEVGCAGFGSTAAAVSGMGSKLARRSELPV